MMRGLTPQNLLEVCEWAANEHPANRALALLYAACPEASWDELAELSIGQRDTRLLLLRELTFGEEIQGISECRYCGEQLEFSITTSEIMGAGEEDRLEEPVVKYRGKNIRFRIPNSVDLIAISHIKDPVLASNVLAQRCLADSDGDSAAAVSERLPEKMVSAIAARMSACDPRAEILVNLHCPECGQDSRSLLDISSFIWIEFMELAKRLMRQVHLLARGYGWSEADILGMSAWRRRYYQDLLSV